MPNEGYTKGLRKDKPKPAKRKAKAKLAPPYEEKYPYGVTMKGHRRGAGTGAHKRRVGSKRKTSKVGY